MSEMLGFLSVAATDGNNAFSTSSAWVYVHETLV